MTERGPADAAWMGLRRSVLLGAVVVLAAPVLVSAAPKAEPAAAAGNAKAILVAEVIPLPRLNPSRSVAAPIAAKSTTAGADDTPPAPPETAGPGRDDIDPIGALIGGAADALRGMGMSEDSDAPKVTASLAPAVVVPLAPKSSLNVTGLKLALKLLDNGDPIAAGLAGSALSNPVDRKIIDWLVATGGDSDVSSARIAEIAKRLPDWPGQTLLLIRYEQAFAREKPGPDRVIGTFSNQMPESEVGKLILARAYLATGRAKDAAAVIRPFWREGNLTASTEAQIRKEFGSLLTWGDKKFRLDELLYAERTADAQRVSLLLDKNQQALAAAVIAVVKEQSNAGKLLAALPQALHSDPIYIYSRVQFLRRTKKINEAAALMLSAPRDPKLIVNGDAWWVERRLVSRMLIDQGDARTAYKIAAGAAAESNALRAEAAFHAGWYALEFLHDPATAKPHFAAVLTASPTPLTQSRGQYWLGRAAAAAGNRAEAADRFRRAGAYPTTFYGQLALAKLGAKRLPLRTPPAADAEVRTRFEGRDMVQAIERLTAAGHEQSTDIFYRTLAETLDDPSELALLATMAEKSGEHQLTLQIGKIAAQRGIPCDTLAFPMAAIPAAAKTSAVERPMVYAIARQESAFNPAAVSSAGARGLLQLMPATAKRTASAAGLPFNQARLTSDPAYNATLGAHHLGELFQKFGRSYVMTFASYNAGPSRIPQWIKLYGDPRDPKVDVVNWIELIPFTETRNYVQRIMENLQVYRARLGAPLTIEADLRRGPAD